MIIFIILLLIIFLIIFYFLKNKNMEHFNSIRTAYNPHICSKGAGINRKYDYCKLCELMDENNNCVKCSENIAHCNISNFV